MEGGAMPAPPLDGASSAAAPEKLAPEAEREVEGVKKDEATTTAGHGGALEEDEGPTCRVCHMEGEPDRPLYHPCWCRGSIKHVHQDCLMQWLTASKNTARRCELCGGSFTFAPVYAHGAPKELSVWELVSGLQARVLSLWPVALHGSLLATLWLVVLPIITSAVFQVYFCATLSELRALFSMVVMCKPRDLVVECLGGTVLCTSIVVISLLAVNLRDMLLVQARAFAPPRRRIRIPRQNMEGGLGEDEALLPDDDRPPDDEEEDDEDDEEEEEGEEDDGGGEGIGLQHLVWPAHGNDADPQADDVFEQIVDMRELIGFNAPLSVSARRWVQLAAYNVAFLTMFQLLPYHIGRCLWAVLPRIAPSSSLLSPGPHPQPPGGSQQPSTPTEMLLHYTRTLMERLLMDALRDSTTTPPLLPQQVPILALDEQGLAVLLDKLLVLSLGYGLLFLAIVAAGLGHVIIATLHNPRQTLTHLRTIQRGCFWLFSWLKVGLFISCDLMAIPLVLGWVMDVATVDTFGTNMQDRLAFFLDWPFVSLSAHWLCGFSFMALAGLLATELRRVLHPDVMRGLLPQPGGGDGMLQNEPAGENIAELLASRSLTEHARKVLLSLLLYLPLLLVVLDLPLRFGHRLLPCFTPLRLHFMPTSALYLEMQLPLELFLFHIAMPLMLERFRLRDMVRWGLEHAFANCCRLMGLGPSLLDHETLHPATAAPLTPPSADSTTSTTSTGSEPRRPRLYRLRLVGLVLLSSTALFLASTFTLHVPIRIGRKMLARVGLPTDHDFYNLGIGLLTTWVALWAAKILARSVRAQLALMRQGDGGITAWLRRLADTAAIAVKAAVLALLWLIALPVLIGMLFELVVIIPARVPVNETPFFSIYEAWALGLVFLKIWVRCALLGVLGSDYKWKQRFERVKANGLRQLDFTWTLRDVIWPVLHAMAFLMLTPYCLLTTAELALAESANEDLDAALLALKRYGYLLFLLTKLAVLAAGVARHSFRRLHDRIRDDQYLVGLELKNRLTDGEPRPSAAAERG